MTTASGAYDAVRSRIAANITTPVYWQGEDNTLPDVPMPFYFVEFISETAALVSFGAGRGSNRYRHPAHINAHAFVPQGWGVRPAMDLAETMAALFRSYRDTDISCSDATVHPLGHGSEVAPPGLRSEVGNYFVAVAEISLFYDLIG